MTPDSENSKLETYELSAVYCNRRGNYSYLPSAKIKGLFQQIDHKIADSKSLCLCIKILSPDRSCFNKNRFIEKDLILNGDN